MLLQHERIEGHAAGGEDPGGPGTARASDPVTHPLVPQAP